MEIRGPVNFGSTVADGKVLTGYFSIDNYGSKAGEFKIKYNGKEPLTLSPTSGVVEAETSQKIKVFMYDDIRKNILRIIMPSCKLKI